MERLDSLIKQGMDNMMTYLYIEYEKDSIEVPLWEYPIDFIVYVKELKMDILSFNDNKDLICRMLDNGTYYYQ